MDTSTSTTPAAEPVHDLTVGSTAPAAQPQASRQRVDPHSRRAEVFERYKTWTPSVSHPYLMRDISIRSHFAQDLFNVVYFRAQVSVYQVGVMLPLYADQDESEEFENHLLEIIDGASTALGKEIDRLQKIKTDNGVSGVTGYTKLKRDQVVMYTPVAGKLLDLLHSFDALISLADDLWMSTKWKKSLRDSCIHEWRRRLTKMGHAISRLQVSAKGAIKRHRIARELERVAAFNQPAKAVAGVADAASSATNTPEVSAIPDKDANVVGLAAKAARKTKAATTAAPVAMAADAT